MNDEKFDILQQFIWYLRLQISEEGCFAVRIEWLEDRLDEFIKQKEGE